MSHYLRKGGLYALSASTIAGVAFIIRNLYKTFKHEDISAASIGMVLSLNDIPLFLKSMIMNPKLRNIGITALILTVGFHFLLLNDPVCNVIQVL